MTSLWLYSLASRRICQCLGQFKLSSSCVPKRNIGESNRMTVLPSVYTSIKMLCSQQNLKLQHPHSKVTLMGVPR